MTFSRARVFAKSPLRGFSLLRSSFLLIFRRSLRDDVGIKIRASTIFILISSLAELVLYVVPAFFSFQSIGCILQGGAGDGAEGFVCKEALVRGDHYVGEGQKSCSGGVFQDFV